MRSHKLYGAIALSLLLGAGEAAVAQVRGPPVQVDSVGDIARQEDLDQRLQNLQKRVAGKEGPAAQIANQARALQAKLRSQPSLSDQDLNNIEAAIQRLENTPS